MLFQFMLILRPTITVSFAGSVKVQSGFLLYPIKLQLWIIANYEVFIHVHELPHPGALLLLTTIGEKVTDVKTTDNYQGERGELRFSPQDEQVSAKCWYVYRYLLKYFWRLLSNISNTWWCHFHCTRESADLKMTDINFCYQQIKPRWEGDLVPSPDQPLNKREDPLIIIGVGWEGKGARDKRTYLRTWIFWGHW